MYAVIRTGGKQYRVKPGDVLEIEHLSVKGDAVTFSPILISTDDGKTLHGSAAGDYPVAAKLLGDAKGDKVIVFKYRNKTGYASKTGHRQLYSLIEITSIGDPGAEAATATPPVEAEAAPEPVVEAAAPVEETATTEEPAPEAS